MPFSAGTRTQPFSRAVHEGLLALLESGEFDLNRFLVAFSGGDQPNAWGLRDVLGNLYEWVSDFSTVCGPEEVTDPTGPEKGQNHPYRGGSWNHYTSMCRAAKSFEAPPTYRVHHLGFRVVMVKE